MKIRPEHYQHMLEAMRATLAEYPQASWSAYNAAGRSAMVHRWDLCHLADLTKFICDNIYSYANDTHIDTALRSIIKEIT